jgi:hypothetical protein
MVHTVLMHMHAKHMVQSKHLIRSITVTAVQSYLLAMHSPHREMIQRHSSSLSGASKDAKVSLKMSACSTW